MALHTYRCARLHLAELLCAGDEDCLLADYSDREEMTGDDLLVVFMQHDGAVPRIAVPADFERLTLTAVIAAEKGALKAFAAADREEKFRAFCFASAYAGGIRGDTLQRDLDKFIAARDAHLDLSVVWRSLYDARKARETASAAGDQC